jgi:hypothetical protein
MRHSLDADDVIEPALRRGILKALLRRLPGCQPVAGGPQKGTGTGILGRSQSPFASAGAPEGVGQPPVGPPQKGTGRGVLGRSQSPFAFAGRQEGVGQAVVGSRKMGGHRRPWPEPLGIDARK